MPSEADKILAFYTPKLTLFIVFPFLIINCNIKTVTNKYSTSEDKTKKFERCDYIVADQSLGKIDSIKGEIYD